MNRTIVKRDNNDEKKIQKFEMCFAQLRFTPVLIDNYIFFLTTIMDALRIRLNATYIVLYIVLWLSIESHFVLIICLHS